MTLRDATFGRDRLARIAALGTPLASFFSRVIGPTLAFDESVGIPGSTHPDSLSAAIALHPELVTASAPYHVAVDISSDLTRGYAAMSWHPPGVQAGAVTVHGLAPNATVIESVDGQGFFDYLVELLGRPTSPSRPLT